MKARNISSYIWFGMTFRYLLDALLGCKIHGTAWILENINSYFGSLVEFDLPVTSRASNELEKFRDEISKLPNDAELSAEQSSRLRNIMVNIRKTLEAESVGNLAYVITDKRLNVEKLVGDVRALLGQKVFEKLSEIAQFDFIEAGKCIAFELPTAGAFHLLRATEGVLRDFYCYNVKRNRVNPLLWGPMTGDMRKHRKHPPDILLNNLDNIRVSFRNPTQHPEKRYDIDEVQDLFGLCIDVVNRMCGLGL
jgi:hypothetical protein